MGFTPICPKCGSAAVLTRPTRSLECERCNFVGAKARFTSFDDRVEPMDDEVGRARKRRDFYIADRTIKLSDE